MQKGLKLSVFETFIAGRNTWGFGSGFFLGLVSPLLLPFNCISLPDL